MWNFDAHVHSADSDGTDTILELIQKAAAAGLSGFALTDHDYLAELSNAKLQAEAHGLLLVQGVEISTTFEGRSAHLLAYRPDPANRELRETLREIRSARATRLQRIVENVHSDFPQITWQRLLESIEEGGETVAPGRPHLADLLIAEGIVASRAEAFAGILNHAGPYFVPQWAPDPRDMVEMAVRAGAAPVLAHPLSQDRQKPLPERVIEEMAEAGLFGLERDHREHTAADREAVTRLANRLNLVTTGGSDYHGSGKPNLLGENTTDQETMELILAESEN